MVVNFIIWHEFATNLLKASMRILQSGIFSYQMTNRNNSIYVVIILPELNVDILVSCRSSKTVLQAAQQTDDIVCIYIAEVTLNASCCSDVWRGFLENTCSCNTSCKASAA